MKRLISLVFLMLMLICPTPAGAEDKYHPGDVAVINNLLKANDPENGFLARAGWRIDRPATWPKLQPEKSVNELLAEDSYFPDLGRGLTPGVIWREGRLVELKLNRSFLSGPVDLTGLTELRSLDLSGNQITELRGLDSLTSLAELRLRHNRLEEIGDLSRLTRLGWLDLGWNRLTRVQGLGGLTRLNWLDLGVNRLSGPSLAGLENLGELRVLVLGGNEPMTFLTNLGGLKKLRRLDLNGCQLTGLDLTGLENLRTLLAPNSRLTVLYGLEKAGRLEVLNLTNNQLTSLGPLDGLTRLKSLALTNNRLTSLAGLEKLSRLESLNIGGNPGLGRDFFEKFQPGRLKRLGFSGDQMPELSLTGRFRNLESLSISEGAELKSVDLAGRALSRLHLHDRVEPEKFHNSGGVQTLELGGETDYRMAELRALSQRLKVQKFSQLFARSVTLGDVAGGLQAGRAYTLAELSPLLAADYADGADQARLYVFARSEDRSATGLEFSNFKIDFSGLKIDIPLRTAEPAPIMPPPENALPDAFQNGRLTFPAPGEYRLTLAAEPGLDKSPALMSEVIHYEDIFTVK